MAFILAFTTYFLIIGTIISVILWALTFITVSVTFSWSFVCITAGLGALILAIIAFVRD